MAKATIATKRKFSTKAPSPVDMERIVQLLNELRVMSKYERALIASMQEIVAKLI